MPLKVQSEHSVRTQARVRPPMLFGVFFYFILFFHLCRRRALLTTSAKEGPKIRGVVFLEVTVTLLLFQRRLHDDRSLLGHQPGPPRLLHALLAPQPRRRRQRGQRRKSPVGLHHTPRLPTQVTAPSSAAAPFLSHARELPFETFIATHEFF